MAKGWHERVAELIDALDEIRVEKNRQISELATENVTLREALEYYGEHGPKCATNFQKTAYQGCDCGLDRVLEKARPERKTNVPHIWTAEDRCFNCGVDYDGALLWETCPTHKADTK